MTQQIRIAFNIYQTADVLKLSQSRVRWLCAEGILRAKKVKKGTKFKRPGWRVTPEELIDFTLRRPELARNRDESSIKMIRKVFM